jgi:hypothetical protein
VRRSYSFLIPGQGLTHSRISRTPPTRAGWAGRLVSDGLANPGTGNPSSADAARCFSQTVIEDILPHCSASHEVLPPLPGSVTPVRITRTGLRDRGRDRGKSGAAKNRRREGRENETRTLFFTAVKRKPGCRHRCGAGCYLARSVSAIIGGRAPAVTLVISPLASALCGLVMADHTACAGPEQPVVTGIMPRDAADDGAFNTPLGRCGRSTKRKRCR